MAQSPGFEEFLKKKRIDSVKFKASLSQEWLSYQAEFDQSGEASFDARKKFFLNNLRLQFPLDEPS